MNLPQKGQNWQCSPEPEDVVQIQRVTKKDVYYAVPATGAAGICELLYFLNRYVRIKKQQNAKKRRAR